MVDALSPSGSLRSALLTAVAPVPAALHHEDPAVGAAGLAARTEA